MSEPRVGCGAAVVRDGRVLLVQRLTAPEAGAWSLPGGKVDFLESAEDAAVREVFEETSLRIALDGLLCLVQMIGVDGQHWLSPVYRARVLSGEARVLEPTKASGMDGSPSTPHRRRCRSRLERRSRPWAPAFTTTRGIDHRALTLPA